MPTPPPTPVIHLELHTGDALRALEFYAEVCGWRSESVEAAGHSYRTLEMGNGLGGGVVECATRRPVWLPYVQVREVDEATRRAQELGAAVLLDPREGPAGRRSVVASPSGAEMAFWQPRTDELPGCRRSQR